MTSHLPHGELIQKHVTEVLWQAEGANVKKGRWIGGDAWFGSVNAAVELKCRLGINSTFIVKQNKNYCPIDVIRSVLLLRYPTRPAGHWAVMKTTISGIDYFWWHTVGPKRELRLWFRHVEQRYVIQLTTDLNFPMALEILTRDRIHTLPLHIFCTSSYCSLMSTIRLDKTFWHLSWNGQQDAVGFILWRHLLAWLLWMFNGGIATRGGAFLPQHYHKMTMEIMMTIILVQLWCMLIWLLKSCVTKRGGIASVSSQLEGEGCTLILITSPSCSLQEGWETRKREGKGFPAVLLCVPIVWW